MRLTYAPLWRQLSQRGMNKEDLRTETGLSTATIAKLGKGQNVQSDVLLRICESLNCGINDIVECIPRGARGKKEKGVTDSTHRVVDLFCGCGGMSLGFEQAGLNVVAGFENWGPAITVYEDNFDHPVISQDLSQVADSVALISKFEPDIIIGGPPCQDFSTAGAQDETRGRAELSIRFAEIVKAIMPEYFVMENVANIRASKSFQKVLDIFRNAGYGLTHEVLNAALCGVPQTRRRMFVIGQRNGIDGFLTDRLRNSLAEKPMTIRDYLGDSLGIEHYFRVPTNYSRRGVFSIDEPSMTIRAVDRPIPKGYKGNPKDSAPVSEVRGLTPKERSRIQTFPEEFVFAGSKGNVNSMIGNAVPVKLAEYVASNLLDFMKEDSRVCSE
ncbi:DNA (cytosine-5-)-methyltransferase [Corynebacterium glucuronolyticum]|uniref:DNA (cytosine-5-)-methyltransferase n=1 Tax=Corynebacterium glucuronolyticum TaxID=39791 RepID=UPI0021AE458C|nr:DNA (cytosine-5-)-methyltransferase [Corynebacterium glucuronolyticum]